MKGSSHAVIGTVIGAVVGYQTVPAIESVLLCTLVGGVSALVPDLDTNGAASNGVTISKKRLQLLMRLLAIPLFVMITYQFIQTGVQSVNWIIAIVALLLLVVPQFISQRRLLTITGVLFIAFGIFVYWSIGIILAGCYIMIASFLPHRSYTHSLLGLAFFACILHYLLQQWPMNGVFLAAMAGYASHLVADMKILPVNRRGVKLFAPVWKREL